MWDDDAKVQWWVWLIPAFIGAALAFASTDVPSLLVLPIGFAVMAVIRLRARRKADHSRGRTESTDRSACFVRSLVTGSCRVASMGVVYEQER
jgi:hypothetical protein